MTRRLCGAFGGLVAFALLVGSAFPSRATIMVRMSPIAVTETAIGSEFDLELRADLDQTILGWGLDVSFDASVIALVSAPQIGPLWAPLFTPDGDGLAGIGPFSGVTGADTLLATLHFVTVGLGVTIVNVSATPGDLTEGFPLTGFGFATPSFEPSLVTVPEPRLLPAVALGAWLVLRARGARHDRSGWR